MKKGLLLGAGVALFAISYCPHSASATINIPFSASTTPQPFTVKCDPSVFLQSGGSYNLTEGGACAYTIPQTGTLKAMGIYKGTIGNATEVDVEFVNNEPYSDFSVGPNDYGSPSVGDPFFAASYSSNGLDGFFATDGYLTTGVGTPSSDLVTIPFTWAALDTTPPVISITSPTSNTTYFTTDTVPFTATVTDNSGSSTAQYFFNNVAVTGGANLDFTNTPLGTSSVTVVASDASGNTSSSTVSFTLAASATSTVATTTPDAPIIIVPIIVNRGGGGALGGPLGFGFKNFPSTTSDTTLQAVIPSSTKPIIPPIVATTTPTIATSTPPVTVKPKPVVTINVASQIPKPTTPTIKNVSASDTNATSNSVSEINVNMPGLTPLSQLISQPITPAVAAEVLPYAAMSSDVYGDTDFAQAYGFYEVNNSTAFFATENLQYDLTISQVTGFNANIYANQNTKQLVISFQGTDAYDPRTDITDLDAYFGVIPDSYKLAAKFAQQVIQTTTQGNQYYGYSVVLTGQSLGGAEASYAGSVTGLNSYTFEAARNRASEINNGSNQTNIVVPADAIGAHGNSLLSSIASFAFGVGSLNGQTYNVAENETGLEVHNSSNLYNSVETDTK